MDVYERFAGQTLLVSTGPTASNAPAHSSFDAVSTDGTRVVFTSGEALTADDTDDAFDVYERSAGVTTLLSSGQASNQASFEGASADASVGVLLHFRARAARRHGRLLRHLPTGERSDDTADRRDHRRRRRLRCRARRGVDRRHPAAVHDGRASSSRPTRTRPPTSTSTTTASSSWSAVGPRTSPRSSAAATRRSTPSSSPRPRRCCRRTPTPRTTCTPGGTASSASSPRDPWTPGTWGSSNPSSSRPTGAGSSSAPSRRSPPTTPTTPTTSTCASRARPPSPSPGNGPFGVNFSRASLDASRVFFTTNEKLGPGDTDSSRDVYETTATGTSQISPGNGAFLPTVTGVTPSGSHLFYDTLEPVLPADTDSLFDVYAAIVAAPHAAAPPSVTGTPAPGQTLTCFAGAVERRRVLRLPVEPRRRRDRGGHLADVRRPGRRHGPRADLHGDGDG